MNRFNHSSLSSSTLLQKSIPEIYCSCELSIIPTKVDDDGNDGNAGNAGDASITNASSCIIVAPSTNDNDNNDDNNDNDIDDNTSCSSYQTTAYFRDTQSKRSKVVVPMLLKFENEFDRQAVLRSGAIQPLPTGTGTGTGTGGGDDNISLGSSSHSNSINSNNNNINNNILQPNLNLKKPTFTRQSTDGSDLWASELDTLGEARGETQDESSSEQMELQFECSCRDDDDHAMSMNMNMNMNMDGNGTSTKTSTSYGRTLNRNGKNGRNGGGTIIEGVKILSTSIIDVDDNNGDVDYSIVGIRFDVEIAVRSSSSSAAATSTTKTTIADGQEEKKESSTSPSTTSTIYKTKLNIRSVLVCTSSKLTDMGDDDGLNLNSTNQQRQSKSKSTNQNNDMEYNKNTNNNNNNNNNDHIFLAKQALEMGINCITPYVDTENNSHLPASSYFARSLSYALPPLPHMGLFLNINLVPALRMDVREVNGASSHTGVTLVSLVIYHSNLHNEDVKITNIALHPGHSRQCDFSPSDMVTIHNNHHNHNHYGSALSTTATTATMNTFDHNTATTSATSAVDDEGMTMPGGENAVINMLKHVRWGYVQGTAPSLPLTLKPQDAIATVIQINASERMTARTLVSPICVRGVIGENSTSTSPTSTTGSTSGMNATNGVGGNGSVGVGGSGSVTDTFRDEKGNNTSMVMVSADAKWTTARVATGITDAYRISLSVQDKECNVGAQIVVSLKVMNLSDESRNLTLVMAKEENLSEGIEDNKRKNNVMGYAGGEVKDKDSLDSSSSSNTSDYAPIGVNNAVVYEVNGYTFGVWGLSGEDDGTVRYSRDHELLAVDAALLLGEVKGQHSIEAELRFVPLREGILKVPNLRLYDTYNQNWYDCIHTLKIVAVPNQ